jgi:ATP citrate (pro-S)-lyase
VQFGHAGASAAGVKETARAKNAALREAGAVVPKSFDELGESIEGVFKSLVNAGKILPKKEVPPPPVPMDYNWAREVGLIRRPAAFVTSMTDERGDELLYSGVKISEVVESGKGMGGVMALLWFQRDLPDYFCKFMEICLMVTADHGPAVAGAHNTIVSSRAGKDLVSSLCSGLLTIGDRFGGALNDAAEQFSGAFDRKLSPTEFVAEMRKNNKLIMGIGHRVKSIENPDARVKIIKEFVRDKFPRSPLFDYALKVEAVTTRKRSNLILNVDGAIAVAFVDLLRESGRFTRDEADRYLKMGILNGIFVLGRTTGFIGHYIDQLRLDQGLYRHPWDDISYIMPNISS